MDTGADGSLSTFKVSADLPANADVSGEIQMAIESERVPEVSSPQTPAGLPRAHYRMNTLSGGSDPRASGDFKLRRVIPNSLINSDPSLQYQRGANRWQSTWVRAIADPRASNDYNAATATQKKNAGCESCEKPSWLPDEALELWSGGRSFRIRLDDIVLGYEYLSDAGRMKTRIGTVMADSSRPADVKLAAQNAAPAGAHMEKAVHLHDGEVELSGTDLAIRGRGLDFVLSRTYDSAVFSLGPLGRSIDSNLFARLRALPDGSVDYFDGTGRRDRFTSTGDGPFTPPPGIFIALSRRDDDSYALVLPDRTLLTFDTIGRLTRISDRNRTKTDGSDGNSMSFIYRHDGLLDRVIDPTDRTVRLDYWPNNDLLHTVTDFDSRTVTYDYDASGRLKTVTGPDPASASSAQQVSTFNWSAAPASGEMKQVVYQGSQLTSETD